MLVDRPSSWSRLHFGGTPYTPPPFDTGKTNTGHFRVVGSITATGMALFDWEGLPALEDLSRESLLEYISMIVPGADAQARRHLLRQVQDELASDDVLSSEALAGDLRTQALFSEAGGRSGSLRLARVFAAEEEFISLARARAALAARQHDFKLLDTVYSDFMGSNRHVGEEWALPDIMKVDAPHPGKEFVFTNKGDLYISHVWRRDGAWGPQVNLKLVNDGFVYISKPGRRRPRHSTSKPGRRRPRHSTSTSQQPGWVKMDWDTLAPDIPKIKQEVMPLFRGVTVWYNKFLAKLDLEFITSRDRSMPDLTIGFEPGKPAYDRQKEAHWFDGPPAAEG